MEKSFYFPGNLRAMSALKIDNVGNVDGGGTSEKEEE